MKYFPKATKELKNLLEKQRRKDQINLSIEWFPKIMKDELMKHLNRPGWKKVNFHFLYARLLDEVIELDSVLFTKSNELRKIKKDKAIRECADVANFAMMIADNLR